MSIPPNIARVSAAAAYTDVQASSPGVIFQPTTGIDTHCVAQAQATLLRRILRAFVGRGLLESFDAKEMLTYQHSWFSVDAGVCIDAHDRHRYYGVLAPNSPLRAALTTLARRVSYCRA